MPSNKTIQAQIAEFSDEDTEGLSNVQLAARLSELKAKSEDAPEDAVSYVVAPGKALTCKRGVVSEGEKVKAEHFPGGQETLDNLVEKGFVLKS